MLVTGASGFVGRAVCDRALSLGMKVKGTHRSLGSQSLVPPGVEKIPIPSLGDDTDWSLALVGVDVVIHLAARVHVTKEPDSDQLAAYREVNTSGTERLARMAVAARVRRLVYVSSIKVNGEQTSSVPFTEADVPRPTDPYARSKWEAELALHRIESEAGLDVVILRPPIVYGRYVGANFLRLLRLVQRRIPVPLASVSNRRSLIYVKNLADAILNVATHSKTAGRTFLVSDGEDVSTPELIRGIANAMNLQARMLPFPPGLLNTLAHLFGRSTEVRRLLGSLVIDSTKIRSESGWVPPYTLSQGRRETVKWYFDEQNAHR